MIKSIFNLKISKYNPYIYLEKYFLNKNCMEYKNLCLKI